MIPVSVYNAIFLANRVKFGSLEHVVPILLAVVFGIVFINFAKQSLDKQKQKRVLHVFACCISGIVLSFHLYKISLGHYNIKTDLPLYLCSLLALLVPVFTYYRKFWMFEILLFWIIAATTQGVLTPDIPEGFPSFDYFRYWVVHLGLLIIITYAIFVYRMRPKFKSVFKSFVALQIYVVLIMLTNDVLDANYFYLNEKPESASLLDYFGEWPLYIVVVQLLAIPYFLLIYSSFFWFQKRFK